MLQLTVDLAP